MWCCGCKCGKEGGGNVGILEALLHPASQFLRDNADVDGFGGGGAGIDNEFSPTLVVNKDRAESLGIFVDEEAELGQDGEPSVVRPDLPVQVLQPGPNHGMGEPVLVGHDGADTVARDAEMRATNGHLVPDDGGVVPTETWRSTWRGGDTTRSRLLPLPLVRRVLV